MSANLNSASWHDRVEKLLSIISGNDGTGNGGATATQFDDLLARLGITPDSNGYPDLFAYIEKIRSDLEGGIYQRIMANDHKTEAYTYLDAGTADERISTITYSSPFVTGVIIETISYAGSSGKYRVESRTRALD